MSSPFRDRKGLDPDRLSPGGKAKADAFNALLMAWLDAAMGFLNDQFQRRAYRELFAWIHDHRGEALYSCRYPDGTIGYVRDPAGVLVLERWNRNPEPVLRDSIPKGFREASIFGWGSTAGSAFVQGKNMPAVRQSPSAGDYYRYVFFDLRRMRALGARLYKPEVYRLDRQSGLLEKSFD